MGRRDPLPDSLDVNRDALSYFKVGKVLPSLADDRDHMRTASMSQVTKLPAEWEEPEDEEENQGATGACGAFTAVQSIEGEYLKAGIDLEFSPLYQYLWTLFKQNTLCQDFGSFMRTAYEVLFEFGALLESDLPYGSRNLCIVPEAHLVQTAAAYKPAKGMGEYVKAGASLQDMLALAYGTNGTDGHPPALCFNVYQNFAPDERGDIPLPSGGSQGGHAVRLCGYSFPRRRVKFKNWWTRRWGVNGYGWLSMDLFGMNPNQGGVWFEDAYAMILKLKQPEPVDPPTPPAPDRTYLDGYQKRAEQEMRLLDESIEWWTHIKPNKKFVEVVQWHKDVLSGYTPDMPMGRRPRPEMEG